MSLFLLGLAVIAVVTVAGAASNRADEYAASRNPVPTLDDALLSALAVCSGAVLALIGPKLFAYFSTRPIVKERAERSYRFQRGITVLTFGVILITFVLGVAESHLFGDGAHALENAFALEIWVLLLFALPLAIIGFTYSVLWGTSELVAYWIVNRKGTL